MNYNTWQDTLHRLPEGDSSCNCTSPLRDPGNGFLRERLQWGFQAKVPPTSTTVGLILPLSSHLGTRAREWPLDWGEDASCERAEPGTAQPPCLVPVLRPSE